MKITKAQLKQIIQEETEKVQRELNEADFEADAAKAQKRADRARRRAGMKAGIKARYTDANTTRKKLEALMPPEVVASYNREYHLAHEKLYGS